MGLPVGAGIGGGIVVTGGEIERGVECFTLPTIDNIMRQWTQIYPLPKALDVLSLLPVDNGLIGICTFTFISLCQKKTKHNKYKLLTSNIRKSLLSDSILKALTPSTDI